MIKRIYLIAFITVFAALIVWHFNRIDPLKNEKIFQFPLKLSHWNGVDIPMEERIYESLETPYAILRNYSNSQNFNINFAIVWYHDKEIAFHSAAACLGGSGERVKEDLTFDFKLDSGKVINVGRIVTDAFKSKHLVLYYYINDDFITGNQIDLRINIIKKRLLFHRTSAAFVRIMLPILDNHEKSEKILENFLELTLPLVKEFTKPDIN